MRFKHLTRLIATYLALALASFPVAAGACAVPLERYDPTKVVSDGIALGVVANRQGEWPTAKFDIKVTKTIEGSLTEKSFSIDFAKYLHGTCGSNVPLLANGDEAVLYTKRNANGSSSLMHWALNPFSKKAIVDANEKAKERSGRRKRYFLAGGEQSGFINTNSKALSYNDPKSWLTYDDDIVKQHFAIIDDLIAVNLKVDQDGNISDCNAGSVADIEDFSDKVCALVRMRARLVPPVFDEERAGRIALFPPPGAGRGFEPHPS